MREALWQRYNDRGFRDALTVGRPDPANMDNARRDAYDRGFAEGKRAERRIIDKALSELNRKAEDAVARA